jgi:hypothetical protein
MTGASYRIVQIKKSSVVRNISGGDGRSRGSRNHANGGVGHLHQRSERAVKGS